jgi:hypothetical protein
MHEYGCRRALVPASRHALRSWENESRFHFCTSLSTASLDVRLINREDMRANIRTEPSGLGKYEALEWAVVSGLVEYKTAS